MRTLFLVRCLMCRGMMPNFGDYSDYQSQALTFPPQKYLQSLAFEVSTDTCPCPQLRQLLPQSPPLVRLGFGVGAFTDTCQHRGRIGRRNID